MLTNTRTKALIPIKEYYFSDRLEDPTHREFVSIYIQAKQPLQGFRPFHSRILSLDKSTTILERGLSKSTLYKIRRAERSGVIAYFERDLGDPKLREFKTFFDEFSKIKGIAPCNASKLRGLARQHALIISYATTAQGTKLVGHAYIVDHALGRARLLYSASHFRQVQTSAERNAIGMANRLLHWQDILHCKNKGLVHYDLGGVATNSSDPQKRSIARFKSEFGGTDLVEFNGYRFGIPFISQIFSTLGRVAL